MDTQTYNLQTVNVNRVCIENPIDSHIEKEQEVKNIW